MYSYKKNCLGFFSTVTKMMIRVSIVFDTNSPNSGTHIFCENLREIKKPFQARFCLFIWDPVTQVEFFDQIKKGRKSFKY